MFESMSKKIELAGLLPAIKIGNETEVVAVGQALKKAGVQFAEICFRIDAEDENKESTFQRILDSMYMLKKTIPSLEVGAGTVISPEQAKKAIEAGASFIISPGFNEKTIDYCIEKNIPIYPGVSTASDIEKALEKGLQVLKFFPAESCGGVATLNAFKGPFPTVKFIPTGGINDKNCADYMQCSNVAAVSGTWMFADKLIQDKKWDAIEKKAKKALKTVLGFEFAHLGINYEDEKTCYESSKDFEVFGFENRESPISFFSGIEGIESVELMKSRAPGNNGHIGILVYSIERALCYLEQFGYAIKPETILWCGKPKRSPIFFAYLDKELGGFAIHLKRK